MNEWYYARGPIDGRQLEALAQSGELKRDDVIFQPGHRPMRAACVNGFNWPKGFAVDGASDYPTGYVRYITSAIAYTVVAILLFIWSVVGFFFWIPLLSRSTLAFSVEILCSTIMNRRARDLGDPLHRAVTFYTSGFANICDAAFGSPFAELTGSSPYRGGLYDYDHFRIDWGAIFFELLWSLGFWACPPLFWNFSDILGWSLQYF